MSINDTVKTEYTVSCSTVLGTAPNEAPILANHELLETIDVAIGDWKSGERRHSPAPTAQNGSWLRNTKAGAYVCKAEADGAGDRDTMNGQ